MKNTALNARFMGLPHSDFEESFEGYRTYALRADKANSHSVLFEFWV
jgi:hypothetical protein